MSKEEGLYNLWVQEFKAEFCSLHARFPSKEEIAEAYDRLDLGQWSEWAKDTPPFQSSLHISENMHENMHKEGEGFETVPET